MAWLAGGTAMGTPELADVDEWTEAVFYVYTS